MRPTMPLYLLVAGVLLSSPAFAGAPIQPGDTAPNFTKNQLAPGPSVGTPVSLSDHAGKVVVLFILGYG